MELANQVPQGNLRVAPHNKINAVERTEDFLSEQRSGEAAQDNCNIRAELLDLFRSFNNVESLEMPVQIHADDCRLIFCDDFPEIDFTVVMLFYAEMDNLRRVTILPQKVCQPQQANRRQIDE